MGRIIHTDLHTIALLPHLHLRSCPASWYPSLSPAPSPGIIEKYSYLYILCIKLYGTHLDKFESVITNLLEACYLLILVTQLGVID